LSPLAASALASGAAAATCGSRRTGATVGAGADVEEGAADRGTSGESGGTSTRSAARGPSRASVAATPRPPAGQQQPQSHRMSVARRHSIVDPESPEPHPGYFGGGAMGLKPCLSSSADRRRVKSSGGGGGGGRGAAGPHVPGSEKLRRRSVSWSTQPHGVRRTFSASEYNRKSWPERWPDSSSDEEEEEEEDVGGMPQSSYAARAARSLLAGVEDPSDDSTSSSSDGGDTASDADAASPAHKRSNGGSGSGGGEGKRTVTRPSSAKRGTGTRAAVGSRGSTSL
jgi:hypothetical protein